MPTRILRPPGSLGGLSVRSSSRIDAEGSPTRIARGIGLHTALPRSTMVQDAPGLGVSQGRTMASRFGGGAHRYLFTVIDVLSKCAWVVPVKNKTGTAVTQAFERVLQQGRKPQRLQMDLGKEFYNALFRRMLEREGIQHFSTHGDAKASIVERFNRALKERMHRYFTARNTRTYLNLLPQLLNGYNQTRH